MPVADFLKKPRILWESPQGFTKVESFFDGTARFAYIRSFDEDGQDIACVCISQQDLMEITLAMSKDARASQRAKNEASDETDF